MPLVDRVDAFEARMADLASEIDVERVREVWDRACAAPLVGTLVWLHGDLHPANVLVAEGVLAAVIDFGDVCSGDPATDVAAAWMLLPASAVPASPAPTAVSVPTSKPALGWAVLFGAMLLAIGLDNRLSYEPIGRRTLDRIVHAPVADLATARARCASAHPRPRACATSARR